MAQYEYKVVPAPAQGVKARGVKAPEDRFALALAQAMNALAQEGWEYQRAETLPCEESKGLLGTSTTTVYRSVLVFRRERRPARGAAPGAATAEAEATAGSPAATPALAPSPAAAQTPEATPAPAERGAVLRAERAEPTPLRPTVAPSANEAAIFRRFGRAEPTLGQPPRPIDRGR